MSLVASYSMSDPDVLKKHISDMLAAAHSSWDDQRVMATMIPQSHAALNCLTQPNSILGLAQAGIDTLAGLRESSVIGLYKC